MKRIVSAGIMAVVMIPILIWGDHYHLFDLFGLLLVLAAAWEMRKLTAKARPLPRWIDALALLFAGLTYAAFRFTGFVGGLPTVLVLLGLMLLGGFLLVFVPAFDAAAFGELLTSVLYASVGFAAVAALRAVSIHPVVYILLASLATDTAAFVFGTRFGKHRLAPTISPKKSVEGALAGTLVGGGAAAAYALLLPVFPASYPAVAVIVLSLALSVVSQVGDLVASRFKRCYGVKDFSNLFPGHGGVLDRFDSTLFAGLFLVFVLRVVTLVATLLP